MPNRVKTGFSSVPAYLKYSKQACLLPVLINENIAAAVSSAIF